MKDYIILFYIIIMYNIHWNNESKEQFSNILHDAFNNKIPRQHISTLIFEYDNGFLEHLISVGLISDVSNIILKYTNGILVNYDMYSGKYTSSGKMNIYFDICDYDFKYVLIKNYYYDDYTNTLFSNNALNFDIKNNIFSICGGNGIKHYYETNPSQVIYLDKSLIEFLNEFTKDNNIRSFYRSYNSRYSELYYRISNNKYITYDQVLPVCITVKDISLAKNIVSIMTLINDVTKKYI